MEISLRIRACSNVKLHPIKNPTISSSQISVISVRSSSNMPFRYIQYFGRSVLKSASGATADGENNPGSVTSKTGHAFGFRWQNNKNSNADALGSTTRLACVNPLETPDVGLTHFPSRIKRLASAGVALLSVFTAVPPIL